MQYGTKLQGWPDVSYIQRHLAPKKLSWVNRLWLNVLDGISRQAQYATLWADNKASAYNCQLERVIDWNKCSQAPASLASSHTRASVHSHKPKAEASDPTTPALAADTSVFDPCFADMRSTSVGNKDNAKHTPYPWDDITPTGITALDDELESDLADAALGLLMTLLLVSATAFACGFVFAKMLG